MKDRLKKALKRAASGLMAVLLAVCLVGTPRAKAVVSEGSLLGSLFGSLLVSMGYSWAADNFDAPTFGEAIYDLIKECDEERDTGIQLLLDSGLAGLTAVGNGKLTFSHQWVKLANSFAAWFQEKFFTGDNTTAVISGPVNIMNFSNDYYTVNFPDSVTIHQGPMYSLSYSIRVDVPTTFTYSVTRDEYLPAGTYLYMLNFSGGVLQNVSDDGKTVTYRTIVTQDLIDSGKGVVSVYLRPHNGPLEAGTTVPFLSGTYCDVDNGIDASSLTAEKPQEVHYPDVAEDGSQVYEITVDGVTATDIEGIIQGAVDRILAGTAAIAGEVAQASTGEIVENPEIDTYKVGLSSVFPFCIPFDVYNMVTMFVAEPEAPSAEWTFTLPWSSQEYSVGWDLSAFDGVARVCRDMELVLFAVGLAVITYKVIKW